MSPTSRSKQAAEKLGYKVAIVEKFNHWAKCRQDLFGIGDLLCMKQGCPVLMIQTTTGAHAAERVQKALESSNLALWMSTGNLFEVWSWDKQGGRGERKLWTLKRRGFLEGP